jgi:hypothetical protein
MLYSAIICGLHIKRSGGGRKLAIPLIVYGTLILGRALYMPIVILLYGILYTRALIGSTRYF